MHDLSLSTDGDGVGWIVLDRAGSRVNLLDASTLRELDGLLAGVERAAEDGSLRALVVRSAKPGSFIAGADLEELDAVSTAREAAAYALEGQRVLRRLEMLPVPTVAAIDGACLAGGTELVLACSYRLASDAPNTRIGLPEIHIGLIPALGGTVRLPRLIGTQAALGLILSGDPVDARRARRLGLVDEVHPARQLEARARRFALERVERGRARTGARRGVARRLLEDTAPGRRLVFARAGRREAGEGSTEQETARRAIEAVAEGLALPLDRAFEREAEIAGELLVSERARALLHAVRLLRGARRPSTLPARPIERAAVLGAGATGSAVAYLLASAGIPVRLRDRRHAAVALGARQVRAWLTAGGGRDSLPAAALAEGTGFGGFGTADLAVVAVGSDPQAIRSALAEVEEHTRDTCLVVLAADDLPLAALQEAGQRRERVVGMRFARPVDRFSLVEIVPGPATTPEALAAAHEFARRLGRTPLLVRGRPLGVLDRLLAAYFSEGLRMVEEGAGIAEVDAAAEEFGWLAGPLRRIDAFGADGAFRLLHRCSAVSGERIHLSPLLRRMADPGAEGPASFYSYPDGKPADARVGRRGRATSPPGPIQDRLLAALLDEAAHLLEEGVSAGEVDLVSLAGLGFPRGRGGLLHFQAAPSGHRPAGPL